jgi:hypothetical protein
MPKNKRIFHNPAGIETWVKLICEADDEHAGAYVDQARAELNRTDMLKVLSRTPSRNPCRGPRGPVLIIR